MGWKIFMWNLVASWLLSSELRRLYILLSLLPRPNTKQTSYKPCPNLSEFVWTCPNSSELNQIRPNPSKLAPICPKFRCLFTKLWGDYFVQIPFEIFVFSLYAYDFMWFIKLSVCAGMLRHAQVCAGVFGFARVCVVLRGCAWGARRRCAWV